MMIFISSCRQPENDKLFTLLSPSESGVIFENTINETPEVNILTYEYTYNGGGVAAADFNNDGWSDLYFSGNTVSNRLFLNLQNLTFKDVTAEAGVGGRERWKTGVTAADVNGDGWTDLYVCYSGPDSVQSLSNQLFINNGISDDGTLTFTERAKEFGLDAPGTYSTQASFFDYDRDGDLDMILINHGNHFYSPFINTNQLRNTRHPHFGNRLYRNDIVASASVKQQPFFTEVSDEAGIHGGGINFGLGVSISDVNNDGWPDIFVTNDYEEQDFLYINTQDGRFRDVTKKSFGHLSRNGMGTDIADFNNDGRTDLIEVDMWPEDNYRQKLLKGPDDYNRYMLMIDSGFHHQQMRNTLQTNAGADVNGNPIFCEMGQLAGVDATDWSWAPLFVDVDNDGFKDLFITNGYLRDFTSMDFLKYTVEEERKKAKDQGNELQVYELVSKMPATKTRDYLYKNNGDLTFSDNTSVWGMDIPNLSFGSAYADLDNDGDQDLITNNTNSPASVWINGNSRSDSTHFLQVVLKGSAKNRSAIGAKVTITAASGIQVVEQFPTRGFQSSVDPVIHFGLGNASNLATLVVQWPDGKRSTLNDIKSDQRLVVDYTSAKDWSDPDRENASGFFKDVSDKSNVTFVHRENIFADFDREPLLPYQLSRLGPALAKGDVNGDGSDDFYIGGASGQSAQLYISTGDGRFIVGKDEPWKDDSEREDTGATFFDADGDGDLDLFVVSGGNEFPVGSEMLDDRLYLNSGNGSFTTAKPGSIVADHASGSCVVAADYDQDGDLDLYVGGRILPGSFPVTTPGALLRNDSDRNRGEVKFTVVTKDVNPDLREPGMVTDALWTDFNKDGWMDLMIVGHFMPVRLFENQRGKLIELKGSSLENTAGLWNRIGEFDFDDDGDTDYILGNAGKNLPWEISQQKPLMLYYGDFNGDERIDPVMGYSSNDKVFPVASRDEMLLQMNSLRRKYTTYALYASATVEDILGRDALAGSKQIKLQRVESVVLENTGDGNFVLHELPAAAQLSAVNGILAEDVNADGFKDIILAGNFYPYRTQYGANDAGIGLVLLGDGKGKFNPLSWQQSGLFIPGDLRHMVRLKTKEGRWFILAARNNERLSMLEYTGTETKEGL